jgi:hypothetical protein
MDVALSTTTACPCVRGKPSSSTLGDLELRRLSSMRPHVTESGTSSPFLMKTLACCPSGVPASRRSTQGPNTNRIRRNEIHLCVRSSARSLVWDATHCSLLGEQQKRTARDVVPERVAAADRVEAKVPHEPRAEGALARPGWADDESPDAQLWLLGATATGGGRHVVWAGQATRRSRLAEGHMPGERTHAPSHGDCRWHFAVRRD